MIYELLIIVSVATLIYLYKFSPTRKNFVATCSLFISVFIVGAVIHYQQIQSVKISRTQQENLLAQQKIFSEWYADYQKEIDHLDRNWQLYHNILSELKIEAPEDFNDEALYLRLKSLEEDFIDAQKKIHELRAPTNLDNKNRELVESIIRKTKDYVDAQTKTISMSVIETTPPIEFEELRTRLHDIMLRESPEGIFISQEISLIRYNMKD